MCSCLPYFIVRYLPNFDVQKSHHLLKQNARALSSDRLPQDINLAPDRRDITNWWAVGPPRPEK